MNEQLDKALTEVLIGASETVGQAKDFLLAEIPEVAQQALLYYGIQSVFTVIVSILTLIAVFYITKNGIKQGSKESGGYGFLRNGYWIPDISTPNEICAVVVLYTPVAMLIVVMATLGIFQLTWLKIWLAPKLWLIEYAGSLISKTT